jgi:hypothetical protein
MLDRERNEAARVRLKEVAARLGAGGASRRTATAILGALRKWKNQTDA